MCVNILVNLSILGYFKYYNFFIENFYQAFSGFGLDINLQTLKVILPVGISFYTFQALSYSIDVYRGGIQPTNDIVSFFAYVGFFPQLVAGPIERASRLLPQFLQPRYFNYELAVDGMRQMLWGFFKKIVVADGCASCVNVIFSDYTSQPGSILLLGGLLFTFQIYGDFSGYSDIALGCSRLFGIELMRNFDFPFFARDIAEFWRRWHISLTTWFRDYLYYPLGGSREGIAKSICNTTIVFLVSGLWHGANWTFVVWGLFNALLFLPLLLTDRHRKHIGDVASGRVLPSLREAMQMASTFVLVVFGFIIFRSADITQAFDYFARMFSGSLFTLPRRFLSPLPWVFVLIVVEWFQRTQQHGLCLNAIRTRVLRWIIYLVIALLCLAFFKPASEFIYFQF